MPTNNFSERVLRLFVLIRKITYGNRSAKGEIAWARLFTVTQTCKLQQRPLLGYLPTAVHCHRRRQPAPSLRPLQNQQDRGLKCRSLFLKRNLALRALMPCCSRKWFSEV